MGEGSADVLAIRRMTHEVAFCESSAIKERHVGKIDLTVEMNTPKPPVPIKCNKVVSNF